MSSKITHLPPGLAHGAPQAKPEQRTQGKNAGTARLARTSAGGKGRAVAQPHSDDELFHHQDLSQGSGEGRGKDAGHEQPAGSPNKALQGPTPPERGREAKSARSGGGVSLGQGRQAPNAAPASGARGAQQAQQSVRGHRADQLKWAQLLQSVPQERLAAGHAALKQHEAALEAFASKVAQLRRGR